MLVPRSPSLYYSNFVAQAIEKLRVRHQDVLQVSVPFILQMDIPTFLTNTISGLPINISTKSLYEVKQAPGLKDKKQVNNRNINDKNANDDKFLLSQQYHKYGLQQRTVSTQLLILGAVIPQLLHTPKKSKARIQESSTSHQERT